MNVPCMERTRQGGQEGLRLTAAASNHVLACSAVACLGLEMVGPLALDRGLCAVRRHCRVGGPSSIHTTWACAATCTPFAGPSHTGALHPSQDVRQTLADAWLRWACSFQPILADGARECMHTVHPCSILPCNEGLVGRNRWSQSMAWLCMTSSQWAVSISCSAAWLRQQANAGGCGWTQARQMETAWHSQPCWMHKGSSLSNSKALQACVQSGAAVCVSCWQVIPSLRVGGMSGHHSPDQNTLQRSAAVGVP